eukprot:gnl/MRDRNA2_/MRDRNA2_58180_c0_seq2.p1 gnl/MRDRNA2_/MRDRNA2_58180_c0~~gnl/MRDRNA2_/MRDRNA2_58180_c0_seq2.p1  ORF type:complete len:391 (+),score=64.18 gnl/MRDRNA2_/MRDRNA2_58180_c0_seq2:73-1173(+)
MTSSIRLTVLFSKKTLDAFNALGPAPWDWDECLRHILKDRDFECAVSPMTLGHLASGIEKRVMDLYNGRLINFVPSNDELDMQVYRIQVYKSGKELRFEDHVSKHLKSGDIVIVDAQAMLFKREPREWTDQELENFRKTLRFGLNDRVLCNCGPRWLSGHIVGTAVPQDDDLLPYLVKTDPLPGLPSSTISVPYDEDNTCTQEICFDPNSKLHLVRAAAALVSDSNKPKLRFAVGDKVVCRIRNDHKDDLEQWVPGEISSIWPTIPGNETWDMGEASGEFPNLVPYKVELKHAGAVHMGGWIYCHRDDHTLIRRQGMEPKIRVRGMSKRIEVRKGEDGYTETIDHLTERRKRVMTIESSDSESDFS